MATKKMNAAVVEQFGKPLAFREWDVPTPGAGQIVVKTEACGVCHTDLHAADGDWPLKPTLPFIPGHEAVGPVSAVGAGVTIVKEGDRVGVPWLYSACGHCEYCLTAWETFRERAADKGAAGRSIVDWYNTLRGKWNTLRFGYVASSPHLAVPARRRSTRKGA